MAKRRSKPDVTPEELDKFDRFLVEMGDVLDTFLAEATAAGFHLDYSLDSLNVLEALLLSDTSQDIDSRIHNRAARYLGQVFRRHVGGTWELCLKDPKYLYFKLPVIAGYAKMPIEFCPIEVVSNFMARKEAGGLRRALEAHLEFRK